jgi:hypothetical protein
MNVLNALTGNNSKKNVKNNSSPSTNVSTNVSKNNASNGNKKNMNEKKNDDKSSNNQGVLGFLSQAVGLTNTVPSNVNQSKRHYFIGTMIKDQQQIQQLNAIQKELITNYKLRDYYLNFNNQYVTRYVYMGYLTPGVAQKYMEHIMTPLCQQIADKFAPFICHYTVVRPKFDKPVNWISLFYEDEKNVIKQVIIPFLHEKGIKEIFPKRYTNFQPMIDLVHFKGNSIQKGQKIQANLPTSTFTIDHLSLISARPTQSKAGYQAIHDNLSYEEEAKFTFTLKGSA